MASPVFSISNRKVTSGEKKLRFSSSDGTTKPSTSIARITLELSLGSRNVKTSAMSAPGSPATDVDSAWSAAVTGGAVGKARDILARMARDPVAILFKLPLNRNIFSSPSVLDNSSVDSSIKQAYSQFEVDMPSSSNTGWRGLNEFKFPLLLRRMGAFGGISRA